MLKSADQWEDDADMPRQHLLAGCTDIAEQLINLKANLNLESAVINVDVSIVMWRSSPASYLKMLL